MKEIAPGDSQHTLGSLLVRMLSPLDHQNLDMLMSILRVLARNASLARDPTVPKVQQKASSGAILNIRNKH